VYRFAASNGKTETLQPQGPFRAQLNRDNDYTQPSQLAGGKTTATHKTAWRHQQMKVERYESSNHQ
jgi:hypothetical protein